MTATPLPIAKTHPHQSDATLALLNHVARHGEVGYAELFAAFEDAAPSDRVRLARLNSKLNYLTTTDRLQSTGRGNRRVFSLGESANQPVSQRGRTNAKAGQTDGSDIPRPYPTLPYLGAVVGARVYISTDPYVPPPQPAMRPGALDYKRHASRGHQC
jgi:hypothetical protein